ncbi:MAG TPA: XdhC family protein [Longimicrobiales bacterium]
MDALTAARGILEANRRGQEIVSVLLSEGAHAGARVLVDAQGTLDGSFDDELLDRTAVHLAMHVYQSRSAAVADSLFAELHTAPEALVIFGAGHIAVPLADLGVKLGFSVTVLDDRTEFAAQTRFHPLAHVHVLDYTEPLRDVQITPHTYLVLVTRAHKYDFDCLRAVLQHDVQPRYIGMIGSRRRVRAAFSALLEGGVSQEQLGAVHAPIGIDIGAETPPEIAVSIAAELIRVRRGGSGQSLHAAERVAERFFTGPNP